MLTTLFLLAATATGSDRSPGPTVYDPLLAFVPPGMESVLCMDVVRAGAIFGRMRHVPDDPTPLDRAMSRARQRLEVTAGRRFRMRGLGMGDFEGLYVQAFEQDVDAERALALLQGVRVHEFGGRRAFEMPRHEEGPLEEWYAQVAPRVLVLATRRAILEQALAAPGRPAAVLARGMGFPGDVDWAASIVLLRRYDPDNPSDVTSPLNEGKDYGPATRGFRITSLQMEWVRRFPGGFRVRVATEDEEKARRFFGELLTLDGARYSPGCLRFRGSFGWGSWSGALSLYILFGFNVFI